MQIFEYARLNKNLLPATLVALALTFGAAIATAQYAHAFDPKLVFKEEKPSAKNIIRLYLEKKKKGEDKEAYDVLKYAADQGNPTAQWKLGRMNELGDGVERNPIEAFNFYKMIADRYGEARPGRPEWRITGKAMVALGHYYKEGIASGGVPPNPEEARVIFTTSAMYFRDADGQFELGKMLLESGNGPEEARQGIRMLNLSRQKGHAGSEALLGKALVDGDYLLQDVVRGLVMLSKATRNAPPEMRQWIEAMQQEAFSLANEDQRRDAIAKLQE